MKEIHDKDWRKACDEELKSRKELNVYKIVYTPRDRNKIDLKWAFEVNEDETGSIIKIKARWVVKGYMQTHGVDCYLTHALAFRMSTLRVLISLAVGEKLKISQIDVRTAFLKAILDNEKVLKPPPEN